jgi:hypothetical protein
MPKERDRDTYRDNDEVRDPLPSNERSGTKPDTKHEARADARDEVGDTTRGTDANPIGPEGNDRQRRTDQGSE